VARAKTRKSVIKVGKKTAVKRMTPKAKVRAKHTVAPRRATRPARPARKRAAAPSSLRALAQRIIDVTLADEDEAILALYANDVESSEAGQPAAIGVDALRAKFAGWRAMTTDTSFEPRRVCVDGDTIMIEWLGRVTLAASGRQVEMREVAIHEIRGGKIVREAFYYNPAVLA
jgi:ketosteroid isomerase-like protein